MMIKITKMELIDEVVKQLPMDVIEKFNGVEPKLFIEENLEYEYGTRNINSVTELFPIYLWVDEVNTIFLTEMDIRENKLNEEIIKKFITQLF